MYLDLIILHVYYLSVDHFIQYYPLACVLQEFYCSLNSWISYSSLQWFHIVYLLWDLLCSIQWIDNLSNLIVKIFKCIICFYLYASSIGNFAVIVFGGYILIPIPWVDYIGEDIDWDSVGVLSKSLSLLCRVCWKYCTLKSINKHLPS